MPCPTLPWKGSDVLLAAPLGQSRSDTPASRASESRTSVRACAVPRSPSSNGTCARGQEAPELRQALHRPLREGGGTGRRHEIVQRILIIARCNALALGAGALSGPLEWRTTAAARLQLGGLLPCRRDHVRGETRELGDVCAVALIGWSVGERVEESELTTSRIHRRCGMPVPHARHGLFERGQLVEVRREEAEALRFLHQVPGDRPCDAKSVGGRGATAKLVNDDEGALSGRVEDARGLQHLCHERRNAAQLHVRRAHSAHDRIEDRQHRAVARHETADLVEQDDERDRPDVSTLATHVGPRDEVQSRGILVHAQVVGHEALVRVCDHQNVRRTLDLEALALGVQLRADEAARRREDHARERRQHVQCAQGLAQPLHDRGVRRRHRERLVDQLRGLHVVGRRRLAEELVQLLQFWRGEDHLHLLDGQDLHLRFALKVLDRLLVLLGDSQATTVLAIGQGNGLLVAPNCQLDCTFDGSPDNLHLSDHGVPLLRELRQRGVEGPGDAVDPLLGLLQVDNLLDERSEVPEVRHASFHLLGHNPRGDLGVDALVCAERRQHLVRLQDTLVDHHQVLQICLLRLRSRGDALEAGC
mmetsp:Transcript_24851/g.82808  ORF Transcript_24851/g.82808 Transcript_24851/m.82808 type:complete len:591 (+) Transcript_24851:178-1950(+)